MAAYSLKFGLRPKPNEPPPLPIILAKEQPLALRSKKPAYAILTKALYWYFGVI